DQVAGRPLVGDPLADPVGGPGATAGLGERCCFLFGPGPGVPRRHPFVLVKPPEVVRVLWPDGDELETVGLSVHHSYSTASGPSRSNVSRVDGVPRRRSNIDALAGRDTRASRCRPLGRR